MRKWLLTIVYLVVSVFLTRLIPFSSFFRNVDTMVHEFSHAVVTLLLSGQVLRIELHADHSGVTYSRLANSWSQLPVALAGYIGASVFSMLLFYLYYRGRLKTGLGLVSVIAILSLVLFVHSGFGFTWLLVFAALNSLAWRFASGVILRVYYLLLAFLTLEESAIGPFSLALYALQDSSRAGDATGLERATGMPALVWALLFVVVALICATRALSCFFKPQKQPAPVRSRFSSSSPFSKNR
ncbi:M50 family metallopeptidase [Cohnella zeiphila]|uniref:M50 family metallopeptidase n=1 Tax=Cohnella zeiphila TaxID=2761120 RepID=A0A7X0SLD2_9BACL|nr:M50 family metallopeptidase [Cohnella zeiphila]MBB6730949.1 M50 family metallopeptidase [Cohnella zeiphila]